MKKYAFLPAALLLLGSYTLTACSDDDDTAAIPDTELTDTESATAHQLSRVLSMLCEDGELSTGWATRQVQPTVGEALNSATPFVRSMAVANEAEARDYFNALAGYMTDDECTQTTWQCDGIGTLAYHALNESDCFATIDVNIKQVPELETIRLVPVSALGENASDFEPYYSFGDVLRNTADSTIWVCGRPACAWAGKKKTYWSSFSLPEKHIKAVTKYANPCYFHKSSEAHLDKVKDFGSFFHLMHLVEGGWAIFKHRHPNGDVPISEVIPVLEENYEVLEALADDWLEAEDYFVPAAVDFPLEYELAFFLGSSVSGKKGTQRWYTFSTELYDGDFIDCTGPDFQPTAEEETINMNDAFFDIREYAQYGYPKSMPPFGIYNFPVRGLPISVKSGKELSTNLFATPDPDKELPGVGTKLEVLYKMPKHKFVYPKTK